jgi:uncharacterized protein YkwD
MARPRGLGARLLCCVVVSVALAGQPGSTQAARARSEAGDYAQRAYAATNVERRAADLDALAPQKCLDKAAGRQAKAMAATEHMFHQDIRKLLGACGLSMVGENVAFGYLDGTSVVRDGWMKSPGHRANILNPAFTLMGIGARKGHNGRWYVSQVFGDRA